MVVFFDVLWDFYSTLLIFVQITLIHHSSDMMFLSFSLQSFLFFQHYLSGMLLHLLRSNLFLLLKICKNYFISNKTTYLLLLFSYLKLLNWPLLSLISSFSFSSFKPQYYYNCHYMLEQLFDRTISLNAQTNLYDRNLRLPSFKQLMVTQIGRLSLLFCTNFYSF